MVENGDKISVNIPERSLTLDVPESVLAERRKKWKPKPPNVTTGYLARYAKLVTSADRGAILKS